MVYTCNVSALKCGFFKVYDANLFIISIIKLLGKAMLKINHWPNPFHLIMLWICWSPSSHRVKPVSERSCRPAAIFHQLPGALHMLMPLPTCDPHIDDIIISPARHNVGLSPP